MSSIFGYDLSSSTPAIMDVAQPSAEHQRLIDAIKSNSHLFTVGSEEIQQSALVAAKATFDSALSQESEGFDSIKRFVRSLTNEMSSQPRETRAQKQSREQDGDLTHPKMSSMLEAANRLEPTPLSGLFLDGMGTDQLWSQLELRAKGICELVNLVFEGEYPDPEALEKDSSQEDADEMEVDQEEWDMEEGEMEEDDEEMEEEEESSEGSTLGEHITPLSGSSFDPSSRVADVGDLDLDRPSSRVNAKSGVPGKRKGPRHPTLDDDFFSISEFNREVDSAEAKSSSRGRLKDDSDEEGSVDLFADVPEDLADDSEEDEGDDDDDDATLMYGDFFEPPAGLARGSKSKPKPKQKELTEEREPQSKRESKVRFHEEVKVKLVKSRRNPLSVLDLDEDDEDSDDDMDELLPFEEGWDDEEDEDEEDAEESLEDSGESTEDQDQEGFDTIERTKDDLFADEETSESDLSSFAQRQLALKKQIEELELENVGKKDWTLMGEANSRSRPINSLLEEDLDFEHRQRLAPVITEEKVKSLEDLIRARILENRYDDVVRRRAFDDKPFLPSKLFELQDTKSAQSLAQIYEEEYTATRAGGGTVDDRDGKLKKEHEELEIMWEGISSKLDALCNAHFTPKAAKGIISTVANVPTTTLESALPTTKAPTSLLAPEEIFASRIPGAVPSKAEMSSREKQALRLKVKKSSAKMRARLDGSVDKFAKMKNGVGARSGAGVDGAKGKKGKMGREKEEKAAALKSVVKSGRGVTVVGKGSDKGKK